MVFEYLFLLLKELNSQYSADLHGGLLSYTNLIQLLTIRIVNDGSPKYWSDDLVKKNGGHVLLQFQIF